SLWSRRRWLSSTDPSVRPNMRSNSASSLRKGVSSGRGRIEITPHGLALISPTEVSSPLSRLNSDVPRGVSMQSIHTLDWKISENVDSALSSTSSSLRAPCRDSEKCVEASIGLNRRPSHARSIQEESVEYSHGAARTNGSTVRAVTDPFKYARR